MKNISLLLLNNFSNKEISSFSRFVESSYFNTDKHIVRLWQLLKQYIIHKRDFDDQWQVKIYMEIFAKEKKSVKLLLSKKEKAWLNAKMSLLIGLVRRFIIIEALENKQAIKNEILYEELLKKQQLDFYYRQIKKERKKQE